MNINEKCNKCVRQEIEIPELWEDKEWKIYKENGEGAYWYIPAEDTSPAEDNIIEGETGEMFYLNKEDAFRTWTGENEESVKIISGLNYDELLAEYENQFSFEDLNGLASYPIGNDCDLNEIELTEEEFKTICNQTIWSD